MPTPPATNLRPLIDALCETLLRMTAFEEQLADCLGRQKTALATGDTKLMHALARLQAETIEQLRTLDELRARTALKLTGFLVSPPPAEPLSVAEIAEHLPEPDRGRLLVLRNQLRDRATEARRLVAVAQSAGTALAGHVGRLVQHLDHRATGGAAYAPTGRPAQAAVPRRSALNLSA